MFCVQIEALSVESLKASADEYREHFSRVLGRAIQGTIKVKRSNIRTSEGGEQVDERMHGQSERTNISHQHMDELISRWTEELSPEAGSLKFS